MYFKFILLCCFVTFSCLGQTLDAGYIKSVFVKNTQHSFTNTAQELQSTILFGFDDLQGNLDEYYYKIIHCNIDWTPSNLPNSSYIKGFNKIQISNVENSFGTLQNYTHYEFLLPNENTKITRSGNYLIQITNNYNQVVCERKLILYTKKTTTNIKISESRDFTNFNKKQAVSLVINKENLPVNYPKQEIKTFIYQNGDLQNSTPFLTPTFISNYSLTYRPTEQTEFYAGNEFYHFDNHNLLVNSRFISKNYRVENTFNTLLFPNKSRASEIYTYNPDINGNFVIRNNNSNNINTESEYSFVYFSLKMKPEFIDKKIYVYGAFNNYQFTEENLLKPDATKSYLTTSILLKQGFYNYDYAIKDNQKIDRHQVSGSFFATENNYEAIIYFQPVNSIYYEIVGYGIANSKQQIEN